MWNDASNYSNRSVISNHATLWCCLRMFIGAIVSGNTWVVKLYRYDGNCVHSWLTMLLGNAPQVGPFGNSCLKFKSNLQTRFIFLDSKNKTNRSFSSLSETVTDRKAQERWDCFCQVVIAILEIEFFFWKKHWILLMKRYLLYHTLHIIGVVNILYWYINCRLL